MGGICRKLPLLLIGLLHRPDHASRQVVANNGRHHQGNEGNNQQEMVKLVYALI